MKRSYYSASVSSFLTENPDSVLGKLTTAHPFALTDLQKNAWIYQVTFLQRALTIFPEAYIVFEFSIPRMGKRVDSVLIAGDLVFVVEFKVGEHKYQRHDLDQVLDYALDLKNFHSGSRDLPIIPGLIATDAPALANDFIDYPDKVFAPLRLNPATFAPVVQQALAEYSGLPICPQDWESAEYRPTPTIIEAAQVLYEGHSVAAISRSDASNLTSTTDAVSSVIEYTKAHSRKAICFITGVPGSGKTLAGLNLATQRQRVDQAEHAVFLSGNGPLVRVLREALARSEVSAGKADSKSAALSKTKAFIQMIHHFRDDALVTEVPPIEKVVIFDEAQRAWTLAQTRKFMARKKGVANFPMSEPHFLIHVMDRHPDWAVIVCLIGGGQEINTGETGLPEWFRSLGAHFPHWDVYVSDKLTEYEYERDGSLYAMIDPARLSIDPQLHLATSIRSFRSENVSKFVKDLLDLEPDRARALYNEFSLKYPIFLTRDFAAAKRWVRSKARGTERFGLVASSGAHRLRPFAITVTDQVDPPIWFLNDATDVRSSYYLEEVATEFDIQGLELDWTIVAWDGDLRHVELQWRYTAFRGTAWQSVSDPIRRMYLKNAYRVLLTRARQGMVIFLPFGDPGDPTRLPEFYDETYSYLRDVGIRELGEA
jgi:hypothetical protein